MTAIAVALQLAASASIGLSAADEPAAGGSWENATAEVRQELHDQFRKARADFRFVPREHIDTEGKKVILWSCWSDKGHIGFNPYEESVRVSKQGECMKFPEYTILSAVDWTKANLRGARLHRAHLERARLDEADLTKADLTVADMDAGSFQAAKLIEASLGGGVLRRANFFRADLRKASFFSAELTGANFRHADLRGAHFWGATAQDANFGRADLREADLRNANLLRAGFYRADLRGAVYCKHTKFPHDMSWADVRERGMVEDDNDTHAPLDKFKLLKPWLFPPTDPK